LELGPGRDLERAVLVNGDGAVQAFGFGATRVTPSSFMP
jgi:hypothetical protein